MKIFQNEATNINMQPNPMYPNMGQEFPNYPNMNECCHHNMPGQAPMPMNNGNGNGNGMDCCCMPMPQNCVNVVNRCFYQDIPHVVNFHTHIVNHVIKRHHMVPQFTQSEETVCIDKHCC